MLGFTGSFALTFAGSHHHDNDPHIALSIWSVPPNRRLEAGSILPRGCRGGADHSSGGVLFEAAGASVGNEARWVDAA